MSRGRGAPTRCAPPIAELGHVGADERGAGFKGVGKWLIIFLLNIELGKRKLGVPSNFTEMRGDN